MNEQNAPVVLQEGSPMVGIQDSAVQIYTVKSYGGVLLASMLLKDDSRTWDGTESPRTPFSEMLALYLDGYAVSGLCRKIATSVNSGFVTEDQKLLQLLDSIDHDMIVQQLVLYGNSFIEVIENGKGEIVGFVPVPTGTIRVLTNGAGFKQSVGGRIRYFNKFTPPSERKTDSKIKTIPEGTGYDPQLNQIIHFKLPSLYATRYGTSLFASAKTQCELLSRIDDYFKSSFDRGLMKSLLIHPAEKESTFSQTQKMEIGEAIKNKLGKEFSVMVVDRAVGVTELEHSVDMSSYLQYRSELLKSLAITLNIPYDLVISDSSNRASSQVAKETFNAYTVRPIQQRLLSQWRAIFEEQFPESIHNLQYNPIDTSDEKETMEVTTGYKKAGILTANEARARLGLDEMPGGDELLTDAQQQTMQDVMKSDLLSSFLSENENKTITATL